jgi:hypothetical protein
MHMVRMGCCRVGVDAQTTRNLSSLRYEILRVTAIIILTGQLVMSPGGALAMDIYTELPPDLTNYDATDLVHISNKADAKTRRQRIIEYLWPSGKLPTTELPNVLNVDSNQSPFPQELEGIAAARVARVARLDVHVDFDYHHISFLLHPTNASQSKRLVIIHQGHQGALVDGIATLSNRMLEQGFTVLLMQMPLTGWNTSHTFKLPKRAVTINQRGVSGHDQMFSALAGQGGSPLRFFIEPVIVGINYFIDLHDDFQDISMCGLSGGGWTTHIAAAIDSRINLSIPVAGAYPLFLRPHYPGSTGDTEQILPGLYEDRASWLDLYVLAGDRSGRRQIQLLNQYDTCCFYGVGSDTYKDIVSLASMNLGGQWECVLDATHKTHQISKWAIENVIEPALNKSKATK